MNNFIGVLTSPWAIEPAKLLEIQAIYAARIRGDKIDIEAIDERIEQTLLSVLGGETESDHFNTLVTEAGLTVREATMLRAYGRYMIQIGLPFALDFIADARMLHPAHPNAQLQAPP